MASRLAGRNDSDERVRFSPTLHAVLFALAVALIAFDRPAERTPALSSTRAVFTDIAAPVLDLAAQPIRAIKGIGPYFRRQGELAEENQRLRDELRSARFWSDRARLQQDQIEVYEEALRLDVEASRDRIGAWTVADPRGPFVRSRLIGSGVRHGVREGYPVINIYGLVGRVVDAGDRSARVLLLTDLNSRIPVMADRTNARGVMIGDNTAYPRLDYLARGVELQVGDRIVTSGDDGVLPRGLPVGEAVPTRDGGWRVQLYSDQAPVDFVWVWPYEAVPDPEEVPAEPPAGPISTDEAVAEQAGQDLTVAAPQGEAAIAAAAETVSADAAEDAAGGESGDQP